MKVIAILTGLIVIAGAVLYLIDRLYLRAKAPADGEAPAGDEEQPQECCGMHVTCERESLLTSVSDEIVYYDDEELDRYAGREAEAYTEAETDEFRDVLLTLRPDDIAGWGRSIQLRGITLPTAVRDELLMIVRELREKKMN